LSSRPKRSVVERSAVFVDKTGNDLIDVSSL
jgi:hypothetical protein